MISKQDFLYKVEKEILPDLILTEKERKKALLSGGFFFVLIVLILFLSRKIFMDDMDRLGTIIIVGLTFLFIAGCSIWSSFISKQKEKFSSAFLRLFGDLKDDQEVIDKYLLRQTCLFSEFDDLSYDDCISGVFDNTEFSVAETKLTHGSGKNQHTVFRGVCIDIPMSTSVSGYILLFNTRIPKHFPVLEKIKLEDDSFGKNYQIYSNSQSDSCILLNPFFRDKLTALKKCFKNKRIDISFFGNHALFAIHTASDLFEPCSLFRSVTNMKTYEKFYDEIKAIYDIINILHVDNMTSSKKVSFNQELYQQITSIQKERSNRTFYIILGAFFLIFILIFVVGFFIS